MNDEGPITREAYEALAEGFAAKVDTHPWNAYYDRPAMLSLLPEVNGKRVLDAGCGPGAYTEILVNKGAEVVAVDASPKMLKLAADRVGQKAQFMEVDLSKPMPFFADQSFDMVLAPLVVGSIRDQTAVFSEFHRVLKSPGVFVFSDEHPFAEYLHYKARGESQNYFATERVGMEWRSFGPPVYMPSYRRPLGTLLNTVIDAGFVLDRVVEPLPTTEFREASPVHYEELMREPGFICIRARKV